MQQPSRASLAMLATLSRSTKHVYGGTVDPVDVARRRARNKNARRSRRINRRTAK